MCRFVRIICSLIVFLVGLNSCGRMSQVKPPEERAPAPARNIVLEPNENSIKLSWAAPVETASGGDLLFLDSFDILRRIIQKEESSSYKELAVIKVPSDADPEAEYNYVDNEVVLGTQYEYLIVPRDDQGIEGTPNLTSRVSFLGRGSLIESVPFSVEE